MQTNAALIWADRIVELHAEAAVYLHAVLIVYPRHAKYDLPIRLDHAFEYAPTLIPAVAREHGGDACKNLVRRLIKGRLTRIRFYQSI